MRAATGSEARSFLSLVILLVGWTAGFPARSAEPNTLTDAEREAGWILLFDGRSLAGWRGYNGPEPPQLGPSAKARSRVSAPAAT